MPPIDAAIFSGVITYVCCNPANLNGVQRFKIESKSEDLVPIFNTNLAGRGTWLNHGRGGTTGNQLVITLRDFNQ